MSSFAQLYNPKVKLDTNRILIGDQIYLHIDVLKKKNSRVVFPVFQDTISKEIEIIEQTKIDTIEVNDELERLIQRLTITSFDSGFWAIPSYKFEVTEDKLTNDFFSKPQYLQVFTLSLDSGENAIFDIKLPMAIPYTLKELVPWIAIGLGSILLILFAFYVYKRIKQNKPVLRREKPKEPAYLIAFRELELLKQKKLWQQGKVKDYYSELTDIYRIYLENRFEIPAMEQTSYEIVSALKEADLDQRLELSKLEDFLLTADLVKFAKENPVAEQNESYFELVFNFIDFTKKLENQEKSVEEETSIKNHQEAIATELPEASVNGKEKLSDKNENVDKDV